MWKIQLFNAIHSRSSLSKQHVSWTHSILYQFTGLQDVFLQRLLCADTIDRCLCKSASQEWPRPLKSITPGKPRRHLQWITWCHTVNWPTIAANSWQLSNLYHAPELYDRFQRYASVSVWIECCQIEPTSSVVKSISEPLSTP